MLSEFRQRKLTHVFNVFDINKDKSISQEDFSRYVSNLKNSKVINDTEAERLSGEVMVSWNLLRESADTNRDEHVTLEEWLAWHGQVSEELSSTGASFPWEKYLSTLMDVLDSNKGGDVSLAEYKAFLSAFGVTNVDAEANFASFDTNGDGVLSKDEAMSVISEWWASEDADAAANLLYGKF